MNLLLRGIAIALAALATIAQAEAAPATALTRVSALPAEGRPSGVPLDYVVTPNGYFHRSCVVVLGDGESVQADGSVLARDGTVRQIAACAHPSFGAHGERRAPDATASFSGWLADSQTDPTVSPPASAMAADWIVPEAPANAAGQTLYFFPGLESVPNTYSILQPVLAWNGYSNSSWTMANWNCCIRGTVYTGQPIAVNVGDQIHGQMRGTGCTATKPCAAWRIVSTDTTTNTSTTMTTRSYGQIFDWWFGGVMEVYGVRTCDQFPASGSIAFTNVRVLDVNAQPVVPTWQTEIASTAPACSYVVNTTAGETVISFDPAQ